MSRAFRLGITGKIGSGKSTLSDIARKHGVKVLEADSLAKEVMNTNSDVRTKIILVFGDQAYSENTLNRSYLASKIFTDESFRLQLEEIVHPATLEFYEEEFSSAKAGEIIALESAILFQTELDDIFDAVILVDSIDEVVTGRLEKSGKLKPEDIANRLREQHYKNEWKEDADFVVTNNGSKEEFVKRCESLIELVKIVAMQDLPSESLRSIVS
jgi:dephospho-CoA kinase